MKNSKPLTSPEIAPARPYRPEYPSTSPGIKPDTGREKIPVQPAPEIHPPSPDPRQFPGKVIVF